LQEKVGLSPATTNIVMAAIPLVLAPLSFVAQRVGDIFGDSRHDVAGSQWSQLGQIAASVHTSPALLVLHVQGGCRLS
jgi:hypothetical protein